MCYFAIDEARTIFAFPGTLSALSLQLAVTSVSYSCGHPSNTIHTRLSGHSIDVCLQAEPRPLSAQFVSFRGDSEDLTKKRPRQKPQT
jgi:hypothetical protein